MTHNFVTTNGIPPSGNTLLHETTVPSSLHTNLHKQTATIINSHVLPHADQYKQTTTSLTHIVFIHPQLHYSIHTLTDTYASNKPSTHREENNTLHKKARAGNNLQKKSTDIMK